MADRLSRPVRERGGQRHNYTVHSTIGAVSMRLARDNAKDCNPSQPLSSCLAINGTHEDGCASHSPPASAFLRPFARRALLRVITHMAALTSGEQTTPRFRPAPSVRVRHFGFVAKRRHTMPKRLASPKGEASVWTSPDLSALTYSSVSAIPTPTTSCVPAVALAHYPSAPQAPPMRPGGPDFATT